MKKGDTTIPYNGDIAAIYRAAKKEKDTPTIKGDVNKIEDFAFVEVL